MTEGPEEMPPTLFSVVARDQHGLFLLDVTDARDPQRLLGIERTSRDLFCRTVDMSDVVMSPATEEDFHRMLAAENEARRRLVATRMWFERRLDEIARGGK